jgi:flagellar biosynthesis GTPase FlhF
MAKSVGYARVSTSHQATDTQVSALKDAGCSNVFYEVISSRTPVEHRHQLQACLAVLEPEDELIVTKLDGTAKGGVLCAIARERAIPVYFIGVGEQLDDLQTFDAREFAEALLN